MVALRGMVHAYAADASSPVCLLVPVEQAFDRRWPAGQCLEGATVEFENGNNASWGMKRVFSAILGLVLPKN